MTSLNKSTGQQGATARDPVAALGGFEKVLKRKIPSAQGDAQDQDLYNVKEHFRIVNKGFQTLKQGRTH
jgi:hypothetical protein